jgi:hypothetical protein
MNAMTYQQMIDSGFEMTADGFWIKKWNSLTIFTTTILDTIFM